MGGHGDRVFEGLAEVAQALANPRRLRLLHLLGHAGRTVGELAEASGQSHATTSAQLQVLARARLVEVVPDGKFVRYHLAGPEVETLQAALHGLGAARSLAVRDVLHAVHDAPETLAHVEHEVLLSRVASGEAALLDLRPEMEFRAGHLPGAVSVPYDQLDQHVAALSTAVPTLLYCRGPWCARARAGALHLRALGLDAHHVPVHVPTWRAHGLPLEAA